MSFIKRLTKLDINPYLYLAIAYDRAKKYNLNYKTLQFSNTKNKKLSIRNDDNKLINFGSSINNDYIIWYILEDRGIKEKGYSNMKRNVFHKSHEAMNYDKSNPYSANNLSLSILW